MCLTYYLMVAICQTEGFNPNGNMLDSMILKSIDYKRRILKANWFAIPALIYFYWRHNTYCEPYVYSAFCLLEYTIVLMNVGYHFSGYYLLYGMEVCIPSKNTLLRQTEALTDKVGWITERYIDIV